MNKVTGDPKPLTWIIIGVIIIFWTFAQTTKTITGNNSRNESRKNDLILK